MIIILERMIENHSPFSSQSELLYLNDNTPVSVNLALCSTTGYMINHFCKLVLVKRIFGEKNV